ncbi:MAG: hypothetical protein ACP5I2_07385 [Fervidicoccaceae archaeon]
MSLLKSLEEKYMHLIAVSDPNLRKYRNAGKEVGLTFYSSLFSSALLLAFYLAFGNIDLMTALLILALPLLLIFKILNTAFSIQSLRKNVEQEFAFLLIASASVSKTGLELSEYLKFSANSKAMKGIKAIGERFVQLSELFGNNEAFHYISNILGGRARQLLNEYASSLSSGTALYMLRDRANDMVKNAQVELEKSIQSRIMLALLLIALLGMAPSMITGFFALQSFSLTEGSSNAPSNSTYAFAWGALAFLPLLLSMIPDYPLAMRVIFRKDVERALNLIAFSAGSLLFLPAMILAINGNAQEFRRLVFELSLIALILSLPGFISTLRAVFASSVDEIAEDMLNHVRVWRSLLLYRGETMERERRKSVKPWIVVFMDEARHFFKSAGDCDPNIFQLLVDFIHESERSLKKFTQVLAIVFGTSLFSPIMSAMMLNLGGTSFPSQIAIAYVSALAYGIVAEKLALGKLKSALIPSITALAFALSAPIH